MKLSIVVWGSTQPVTSMARAWKPSAASLSALARAQVRQSPSVGVGGTGSVATAAADPRRATFRWSLWAACRVSSLGSLIAAVPCAAASRLDANSGTGDT